MRFSFIKHYNLSGLHAPFSASKSSWLRYDDAKALEVYTNMKAAEKGTKLHQWAKDTIDLGIRQPRSNKTLYAYVNDAIGFQMETEVVLYYSDRFFGTADAISFRKNVLRIHDLKTGKVGKIEPHLEQLKIYAALFCLEYKIRPGEIDIQLRVYKNDEVVCHKAETDEVTHIMDRIVSLDKLLLKFSEGD